MGYANSTPYEIIAAPFELWFAVVGTSFPAIDAAPGAAWTPIGSNGSLNYDEEGITWDAPQKLEEFRALGDASPRKVFRIEEGTKLGVVLVDMTLEQLRHGFNRNAITTTTAASGVAGNKMMGLSRGFAVDTVALLARGPSPHGDNMTFQIELPRAAQSGSPKTVFKRSKPAGFALEWTSLVDPSAPSPDQRLGRLRAQTAVALP